MFESRCGVCCNQCERKEAVRCTGCATMEKPFWGGECGVKSCCEAKGLNHCGECPDFPCEMEASMGTDMGFDAEPRLKQCRECLIGVTLGWRLGCLSAVIYLLIGAVGLPVFANFGGGISRLVSLTGGYLWSYPLMAALCGIHPNTGNQKKDTALILLSSLAGLLLVETIGGLQWAALSGGSMSVSAVFAYAAVAFIPKDIILTVLAVFIGLSMRKVLNRIMR